MGKDIKVKEFLSKRVYEFDTGRYFSSIIQFLLTLLIFVKVYSTKPTVVLLFVILSIFFIWLFGFIIIHSDFNKKFQEEGPVNKEILNKLNELLERKK